MILNSVADAIGQTPLVALDRLTRGKRGRIVAKLEFLNPGLSIKDRFARNVIEQASRTGLLAPGQTVVYENIAGSLFAAHGVTAAARVHANRNVLVSSRLSMRRDDADAEREAESGCEQDSREQSLALSPGARLHREGLAG